MKYIILLIILLESFNAQDMFGKNIRYVDAKALTIVNKTQSVGPELQRLNIKDYPQLSKKLKKYFS